MEYGGITICATKSYTYAMCDQARRIVANIAMAKISPGFLILAGDDSEELTKIFDFYKTALPDGWKIDRIVCCSEQDTPNYKEEAQLRIAKMRAAAHLRAQQIGVDWIWSLDSDVLPPANCLRSLLSVIQFDGGYYSIGFAPYPNEALLGGFGTQQRTIEEDFLEHERVLPERLKRALEACRNRAASEKERKRLQRLMQRVRKCPVDGNIWQVIAKHGWRRRGWFENAYPAIGIGAIVPVDWCGFGCTLMNRAAYQTADFVGYHGQGTEDLWVIWQHWQTRNLRIGCTPHVPCDHVIWKKKKGGPAGEYEHLLMRHETDGEYRGHLRIVRKPYIPV